MLKNSDLYKKHDQIAKLKQETYDRLYLKCINIIKKTADIGELFCIFELPSFLFGASYPIINVKSCAEYIMTKLSYENENIKTEFIEPNIIFIDWNKNK